MHPLILLPRREHTASGAQRQSPTRPAMGHRMGACSTDRLVDASDHEMQPALRKDDFGTWAPAEHQRGFAQKDGASIRHSREGGNPLRPTTWMPAFAGMTPAAQPSLAKPFGAALRVFIPRSEFDDRETLSGSQFRKRPVLLLLTQPGWR